MANAHSRVNAFFDEPLNEYKSVQVTRICQDWYDADPRRGFYGVITSYSIHYTKLYEPAPLHPPRPGVLGCAPQVLAPNLTGR